MITLLRLSGRLAKLRDATWCIRAFWALRQTAPTVSIMPARFMQ